MNDDTIVFTDYNAREIRFTAERLAHMLEHPEMVDQLDRVRETFQNPSIIVETNVDSSVHVYHRFYARTPVTSKYLQVSVKFLETDAFVLTAFYSNRTKKGTVVWQA